MANTKHTKIATTYSQTPETISKARRQKDLQRKKDKNRIRHRSNLWIPLTNPTTPSPGDKMRRKRRVTCQSSQTKELQTKGVFAAGLQWLWHLCKLDAVSPPLLALSSAAPTLLPQPCCPNPRGPPDNNFDLKRLCKTHSLGPKAPATWRNRIQLPT